MALVLIPYEPNRSYGKRGLLPFNRRCEFCRRIFIHRNERNIVSTNGEFVFFFLFFLFVFFFLFFFSTIRDVYNVHTYLDVARNLV